MAVPDARYLQLLVTVAMRGSIWRTLEQCLSALFRFPCMDDAVDRIVVHLLQEKPSVDFSGARLRYEGLPKRVVAAD